MYYLVFQGEFDGDFEKTVTPVAFSKKSEKQAFFYVFLNDENGFAAYPTYSNAVKESYGVVSDFIIEKDFPKLVAELEAWENLSANHSVRYVGCRP